MTLVTRTMPEPGPGQLLVAVAAAALNFSDLLMLIDSYQIKPARPFIPGQEIAGTVVACGSDGGFTAGDRVAGKVHWGGFSSHAVMRADMAIRLHAATPFDVAAALPVAYTTAAVTLTECTSANTDDSVLVLAGAGGIGMATIDVARALGARVLAGVGDMAKAATVRAQGAHGVIDYSTAGWLAQAREFDPRGGLSVVVDPVGGPLALDALRCLGWMGRYMVVGFASGEIAQIPSNRLLLKRASAIGVYWDHDRDGAMLKGITERISGWLADDVIHPHVGGRYRFVDAPQALSALRSRRTTGKVVLMLDS